MRNVAWATALLVIGCSRVANGATPTAAPTPPPRPVQLDKNTALVLIRTSLVAVQQANQTGNYSVLYSLSAPGFQSANSPERLSQIFSKLRAKRFDLSGVVVLEPQLSVLPQLYSNGVMRMAGFFPSVPMQVYFDLQFIGVDGQWRLIAIGVDVAPPAGTAPPTAAPSPAPTTEVRPATAAATSTATPSSTPTPTATQSAEPKPAPSVDVGKPKPTPRTSGGLGRSTPLPKAKPTPSP